MHRNFDLRPYVRDKLSNKWFLVDTGAAATIFPKSMCDNDPKSDPKTKLLAVNGTYNETFGKKHIELQFGHSKIRHLAIVASINQPIVGWDLLARNRLDIVWASDKACYLKSQKG